MGILIWFLILSSVSSRNWQAGCVQGLLGFISSSWRLWCIVPLIPQPVSQVPLVTTLLGSQNTRCWWEDPAPDFHTQWNYSLVWVWPPAAASSFPPASPFRSTWKPGCSPPPPPVHEWWVPLEMNPEVFWGPLAEGVQWEEMVMRREKKKAVRGLLENSGSWLAFVGGGDDTPENYLQGFTAQVKLVLQCPWSLQEILMFT